VSPRSLVQPLRFGVVGIVNTVLDLAVFWLLAGVFSMPILIANTLSYSVGALNSFVLNRLWTFRGVAFRRGAALQLPLFMLVSLVGLVVANLTLWLFAQALPVMVAKVVSVAVTFVWNFFASKVLVFRGGTETGGRPDG
jgi:putative flippase GtrA